jgi:negative regulator of flagellin synthesis FlgM
MLRSIMEAKKMKIDGIKSHNIINGYSKNKGTLINKVQDVKTKDTIEISTLGKSLTNYSLQNNMVDGSVNIQEIKNRIENGTYNIDARLTAQSIVENIRGIRL